jgi:hypothetical protein
MEQSTEECGYDTEGGIKTEHSVGGGVSTETPSAPSQRLFVDERVRDKAMLVLRFAVFADAVNMLVMGPNLPTLASPGAHPVRFSSKLL